jgi:hypothetical protein
MVNGSLETVPDNTVALVGSTVTLRCSTPPQDDPTPRVLWTEFVTNSNGRVISDNRQLLPSHPYAERYSITGDVNDYNLEIRNLTLTDGGRYVCTDVNANPPAQYQGFVELVVMAGDPVCTPLSTITGVLVEDRFYTMECDVRYQGFFPPNMTWTGPGTFNVDNSVTKNDSWSRVSFTAYREIDGGEFVCVTRFVESQEERPPNSASNVPDYVFTFTSGNITVNWGPKEMTIIPRKDFYEVGDVLTCEADARPEPTFVWSNLRTLITEEPGATYTVPADLVNTAQQMRCNARTVVDGSLLTGDSFVDVYVPAVTSPTTPPTTPVPTSPPADSPCNDLTGQWTATNPSAQMCLEVDTRGNILALIRNGTDLFFVTGRGKTVYNDYKHVGFGGIWPAGSTFGVGAFTGECHRCFGNEILLMSGLSRNKQNSPACGQSAGTTLTNIYSFTRYGPPCRGLKELVYKPSEDHIKAMGIPDEYIMM